MIDITDTPMTGILIGERTGALTEDWRGTYAELKHRFDEECSGGGYRLQVSTLDGEPVCEFAI